MVTRKACSNDISREQFKAIREMLKNARKKTNRRRVDRYEIFCAIPYLLREGCRWRALPSDFLPVSTMRYYFDQWSAQGTQGKASLLEQALKKSHLSAIPQSCNAAFAASSGDKPS